MGSDCTWVTCAHVMNGCADRVKIEPGNLCLCASCVKRITPENTKEICIVDEERLKYLLKNIEQIDGVKYLEISLNCSNPQNQLR